MQSQLPKAQNETFAILLYYCSVQTNLKTNNNKFKLLNLLKRKSSKSPSIIFWGEIKGISLGFKSKPRFLSYCKILYACSYHCAIAIKWQLFTN